MSHALRQVEQPQYASGIVTQECGECWDSFDVQVIDGVMYLPEGWIWVTRRIRSTGKHDRMRLQPVCASCVRTRGEP